MSASFIAVNENEWQPFYSGKCTGVREKYTPERRLSVDGFGRVVNENDVSFVDWKRLSNTKIYFHCEDNDEFV